ncbi:DUF2062 domain-containing protein [Pseudomonas aeruginosa]|uniref:DUF2062 domain-containing protein n=1 Tax=Pseudomonas aeruginosa TaxID=287 RepID=UPI00104E1635|nr:DUF2062 domain-containing protein [Pseudomonas aeruginosa]
MPRRLFKRYMPDPESIRSQKSLRFLGKLTHDPNLWHLNRHSVSRAMAAGLFAAFIPMPMQMLLAAGLAVWIRSNLLYWRWWVQRSWSRRCRQRRERVAAK